MSPTRIARWSFVGLLVTGALAFAGLIAGPSYAADSAEIFIVQGLPGKELDVSIDGDSVATGVETAAVAGPFKVAAGNRNVTFSEDGEVLLERAFSVKARSSWDVVVHLPARAAVEPAITVDGELQVPTNVDHVGWWDGSAAAGDPFGSTVIAGHVDSATQGIGSSPNCCRSRSAAR